MRRHAVNMSVCARVKNDPESFQRFQDNVHELRALIEQLNAAVGDDQNSLESRKTRLVERVLTYVDFGQRKVPWGASERKARATMHLGMNRLFGPPSYLLTYAPDDVHDPRAIMGGIPFTGRNQFPARTSPDFTKAVQNGARGLSIFEDEETGVRIDTSEAGLQTRAARNPVAVVLEFETIRKTFHAQLLKMPDTRETKTSNRGHTDDRGVLGSLTAWAGVVENNAREALHFHEMVWGAIPTEARRAVQNTSQTSHC